MQLEPFSWDIDNTLVFQILNLQGRRAVIKWLIVLRSLSNHNSLKCITFTWLFFILLFQVKGTVFCTDNRGALVDITAKSSAYLPTQEACIHKIKHVEEAGIVPGLKEEFVIIGENEADDSLVLSLRMIQYELAWERCRQLQSEDVVVKGKVGKNKMVK